MKNQKQPIYTKIDNVLNNGKSTKENIIQLTKIMMETIGIFKEND